MHTGCCTRPSIVTRTFFFFFFLSMHVHVLFSRVEALPAPSRTIVHVSSCTSTRICDVYTHALRTCSSWNSMGTCAYGDGRVTCLPSGPCKHETTLVVSKRRERRSLSSLISPVLLHIYNVYSTPFATLPSNTHFEGTVPPCKPWENETKRNERVKWMRFIKPNPNVRAMCTNKVSSIIGTLQEDDWFK